jgi:hypothetical protein
MGGLWKNGLLLAFALATLPDGDATARGNPTPAPLPTPEVVIVGSFANNDQGDKVQVACVVDLYRRIEVPGDGSAWRKAVE